MIPNSYSFDLSSGQKILQNQTKNPTMNQIASFKMVLGLVNISKI